MKYAQKHFSIVAVAAALLTISAITVFARDAKETDIKKLDTVNVNRGILDYSYIIKSKCPGNMHTSAVVITTESAKKVIKTFLIKITDSANESMCAGSQKDETMFGTVNLANEIEAKSNEMTNRGFKIDPEATLILPPVSAAAIINKNVYYRQGAPFGWKNEPAVPSTVSVMYVDYTPLWKCELYKNNGDRRDGYEGSGATLEEARRDAADRCKRANNSYCDQYSNSPEHTACAAQLQETTKVVQYDTTNLPNDATAGSWKCVLSINDGLSRNFDGFEGNGNTEFAARSEAADKCSSSNNPRCHILSMDDNHTICSQQMAIYGPKPSILWKCSLWKNDGSRNDGFSGSGATEHEARENTISGCQRTNNPNCAAYSNDPAHTQCSAEFVYPQ
jgi:hypothetical protein